MYEYNAKVIRVIDGDTLDVDIDCGFNVHVRDRVRLLGINTPEISGPKAKEEKTEGLAAKAFVEQWVANNPRIVLKSFDAKKLSQEKYGRWLAIVMPIDGTVSLNDELVNTGHAVKYP